MYVCIMYVLCMYYVCIMYVLCICVGTTIISSFPASFLDIVVLAAFLTSFSAYVTVSPGRRERGQSFARNSEDTLRDAARNTGHCLWTRYDNHPLEFACNFIEGETHNLLTYQVNAAPDISGSIVYSFIESSRF